jgi:hypothetical protein
MKPCTVLCLYVFYHFIINITVCFLNINKTNNHLSPQKHGNNSTNINTTNNHLSPQKHGNNSTNINKTNNHLSPQKHGNNSININKTNNHLSPQKHRTQKDHVRFVNIYRIVHRYFLSFIFIAMN